MTEDELVLEMLAKEALAKRGAIRQEVDGLTPDEVQRIRDGSLSFRAIGKGGRFADGGNPDFYRKEIAQTPDIKPQKRRLLPFKGK